MKTDIYTKFILTIIAICLSINVLTNFGFVSCTEAKAAPSSSDSKIDVNVVGFDIYGIYNTEPSQYKHDRKEIVPIPVVVGRK